MSKQYDDYLREHKANVRKGYEWIRALMPEILVDIDCEKQICEDHDKSKFGIDEYVAYDRYFYGKEKTDKVVDDFNKAWLLHIHRNPHHWQYWVLINDNPDEGEIVLPMPTNYIIEMICDWWAFSWAKNDLTKIFKWYDAHKKYMKLHKDTRQTVEAILGCIERVLEETDWSNQEEE